MTPLTQWIGLYTLARKEVTRIFRIWPQTLLPSIITTSLYFLIFGAFIGQHIQMFASYSYIQFIIPGLIMMSIITNSYMNVSSSFFGSKFQRNIEELLVSPLKDHFIILGYLSGGVIRSLIVGLSVATVSSFFSPIPLHSVPIVCLCAVLTSILFSLLGLLNGIFAKKFDDISIVPTFLLTPLIYLGGVFYSVQILPPFWKQVSFLNPILYLVNIFRYGCLGVSDINVTVALSAMVTVVIVLFVTVIILIKRGVGIRT